MKSGMRSWRCRDDDDVPMMACDDVAFSTETTLSKIKLSSSPQVVYFDVVDVFI